MIYVKHWFTYIEKKADGRKIDKVRSISASVHSPEFPGHHIEGRHGEAKQALVRSLS